MDKNRPLFIFEMANNHQGSVGHGMRIIREIRAICDGFPEFDYAFKLQYRDLDTFIHPDFKERSDIKNVKRFQDTRLSWNEFAQLRAEIKANRFLAVCTPFDEASVDQIIAHEFDVIKVASCSFSDWPLLEKIAGTGLPVIASGAGSDMQTVRNVVSFFTNRGIDFTLMHCVAEYPAKIENLQMNQIDFYREAFPDIRIGFSTHEAPDNTLPVQIAISKGAAVLEKHVGLPANNISLNAYSASPQQVRQWLLAAREAFAACGVVGMRYQPTERERTDLLALRRGVFAKSRILENQILCEENTYLAFPCQPGQLTASDLSKYSRIRMKQAYTEKNSPIMLDNVEISNTSDQIRHIVQELIQLLAESRVVVPAGSRCELSHHYGIENYHQTGVAMIDCVNREYCKKILIVLPGQSHPPHYHALKEETFVILYGTLSITLDGTEKLLCKGDVMTVERNSVHSFSSKDGCVFEEISTTHYRNDSYYNNGNTFASPRKTKVCFTKDMMSELNGEIKKES